MKIHKQPQTSLRATLGMSPSRVTRSREGLAATTDVFTKAPSTSVQLGTAVRLLPTPQQGALLRGLSKQTEHLKGLIGTASAEVKGRISAEIEGMTALGKSVLAGGLTLRDAGFLQHVLGAGDGTGGSDEGVDLKYISNDGTLGTDLWSKITGQRRGPQTLPDYVDQAIADAEGKPIRSIEFCGHGTGGLQTLGPDGVPGSHLRSPLTPEQRDAFRRLGESMAPDGKIVLGGCNVAEGPEGRKLMQEIAEASGRPVEAGETMQLPTSGIEGRKVTAYPDGREPTVTTTPAADAYDTIAKTVEQGQDWLTRKRREWGV